MAWGAAVLTDVFVGKCWNSAINWKETTWKWRIKLK
jgi:hypothetical protein